MGVCVCVCVCRPAFEGNVKEGEESVSRVKIDEVKNMNALQYDRTEQKFGIYAFYNVTNGQTYSYFLNL